MTALLYPAAAAAIVGLLIACPIDRRGRGRNVSRRLGRAAHLDKLGVMGLQTVWLLAEVGAALTVGQNVGVLVMMVVLIAWLLDDLFTGGRDDDPKRKHEWARIRLRMPKPVKLRPAERVPAPVPA
jgi:hypothetical protein